CQRRIAHALEIPLHIVAGELSTGMVGHSFPQVERHGLVVGRDVPALGEAWLRLSFFVVVNEPIESKPVRQVRPGGSNVAVNVGGLGRESDAEHAAWPR